MRTIALVIFQTVIISICVEEYALGESLVVDTFDDGIQNRLGGYRNGFSSATSKAAIRRVDAVHRGHRGRSLRVTATKNNAGFCGAWIHLFDFQQKAPTYFDASRYQYLSLWFHGNSMPVSVRLADRQLVVKESSIQVGIVSAESDRSDQWREMLIPLNSATGIDLTQLGAVVLQFEEAGPHEVHVDDISFKQGADDQTPFSNPKRQTSRASSPSAMWVWNTKQLLLSRAEQTRLFRFCLVHEIDQLWMQLPYRRGKTGCNVTSPNELRELIRSAKEAGIHVHALDGHPEFSQPHRHQELLDVVDAIVRFNKSSSAESRFHGIHFDNEPYLLVGWADKNYRQDILHNFLQINTECQRRATEAGMVFGIDIPFWWHARDPITNRPIGDVRFRGKLQPASFHCLELFDNVGVMNYRAMCDGADGMIAHGQELMKQADLVGKAVVYQGVETFISQPTTVWFVPGIQYEPSGTAIRRHPPALAQRSHMDGFRLRAWDDGKRVHVGVELPTDIHSANRVSVNLRAAKCLSQIRETLGIDGVELDDAWIAQRVKSEPSLSEFRLKPIEHDGQQLAGFQVTSKMLPKITFANRTMQHFLAESQAADQYFSRFSSHSGLAIHYYESFQALTLD